MFKNQQIINILRFLLMIFCLVFLFGTFGCGKSSKFLAQDKTESEVEETIGKTYKKVEFENTSATTLLETTTSTSENQTIETTNETTEQSSEITTVIEETSTATTETGLSKAQLVGDWKAVVLIDYFSEDDETGELILSWSEDLEHKVTITHAEENKYVLSFTIDKFLGDGEAMDEEMIRETPLNYTAQLNENILNFELESELYARTDIYSDGLLKPLKIELPLKNENGNLTGQVTVTDQVEVFDHQTKTEFTFKLSQ